MCRGPWVNSRPCRRKGGASLVNFAGTREAAANPASWPKAAPRALRTAPISQDRSSLDFRHAGCHGIFYTRHAMISVALNPDIEQRLIELAKRRGLSEGDFA